MPHHCSQQNPQYSRRDFLTKTSLGLGALSLASFLQPFEVLGQVNNRHLITDGGALGGPHFAPRVKRVIYLFQSGAPSQLDLFDPKPLLKKMNGEELPASVRGGQRLTGMTAGQNSFPLAGSVFDFKQHGQSGAWVSELMPHTAEIVDELCFIKSMYTEAINHDPAATFIQTGSQFPDDPLLGLGSVMA